VKRFNLRNKKLMGALLIGTFACFASNNVAKAEEANVFTLDQMLVTATRYETKDLDLPAATKVFTKEEIKDMGAKTVMEVMQNIPGFVISESPSGNGSPGFRGISGHLSILVNGIPLANEGYFQMGTFATSGIERIEVVKGGSAVLYGSDATSGVINIITKKNGSNEISIGAGDHGQRKVDTFIQAGDLSVAYQRFQEQQRGKIYHSSTDYYGDKLERDNININYKINQNLNLMYLYSKKSTVSSKIYSSTGLSAGSPWENDVTYNIGQLSYINKDLRVLLYGQGREWEYVNPSGHQKGSYYGADVQNKWAIGKTLLTVGGNYEHEKSERISSDKWLQNFRDKGAVFFLTEANLAPKTKLITGAREVFSDASGNVFCPQVQILHKLSDADSVYINVNKSLREPDLSQKYGYSESQVANPDLKPENAWTYEIGWKKELNKNDYLTWDVYHMEIDDRIYSTKVDGKTIYMNAAKYKNTGTEFSYGHSVNQGISYSFGISYGDPYQQVATSDVWTRAENRLSFNTTLGYRLAKTSVSLIANYAGQRISDTEPMLAVNMNIRQRLTNKDAISLKINNLLNREDCRSSSGGSLLEERNWLLSYERSF